MQNEWKIKMPYTDRDVVIGMADTDLSVEIKDERYTVVVARRREAALAEHFYSVDADIVAEGLSYRLLYIFCDESGKELAKGYFMEGRRVASPVGTASVDIEVLITSEGCGALTVRGLSLCDRGAYQPRRARVVALSSYVVIDPGAGWFRTHEESVAETLASIDLVAEREHPDMIVLTENVFQRTCFRHVCPPRNTARIPIASTAPTPRSTPFARGRGNTAPISPARSLSLIMRGCAITRAS